MHSSRNRGNYKLLVRNIELNGYTNVIAVNKAVSNECGIAELFLDRVSSSTHSLSQDNTFEKAVSIEVETVTLDEFFKDEKVDIIKLDAQGAEGLILDGAENILKQDELKIMMEFWPEGLSHLGTEPSALLHKLQEMGFKIKVINETTRYLLPAQVLELIDLRKKEAGRTGLLSFINLLLEK